MTANDEQNLYDIAKKFFLQKGFEITEEIILKGKSGKEYNFEMMIKINSNVKFNVMVVKVLNWRRTVGVDQLIRFERLLNDLDEVKGMVISNRFSDPAMNFAKRRGMVVYSREDLLLLNEYERENSKKKV